MACGGHVCLRIGTKICNFNRGPSNDGSYQVMIHLARWSQRRRYFRNQPIRKKNGLWQPYLLTDQKEISILYSGPSLDASYQVPVHLVKRFRGEDFFKSANQKQELPVQAMFVNGSGKHLQFYRGPAIDTTYQISVLLGERFQRRRFFRNQQIKKKNSLWRPCLVTDRN